MHMDFTLLDKKYWIDSAAEAIAEQQKKRAPVIDTAPQK